MERFSIGFGPPIFSWKGSDGTQYQVAWFPLGGYVLLPQLADLGAIEGASETDAAQLPPVGYRTKVLVFVAGAAFNILFAFALACVIWMVGQPANDETTSTTRRLRPKTIELPGRLPDREPGRRGRIARRRRRQGDRRQHRIRLGRAQPDPDRRARGATRTGARAPCSPMERAGQDAPDRAAPAPRRRRAQAQDRHQPGIRPERALGRAATRSAFKAGFAAGRPDRQDQRSARHERQRPCGGAFRRPVAALPAVLRAQGTAIELVIAPAHRGGPCGGASSSDRLPPDPPVAVRRRSPEQVSMTLRTLGGLLNPHSDIGLVQAVRPGGDRSHLPRGGRRRDAVRPHDHDPGQREPRDPQPPADSGPRRGPDPFRDHRRSCAAGRFRSSSSRPTQSVFFVLLIR